MKILWIINLALPETYKVLGGQASPFGGWLVNASKLIAERNIELIIAYPFKGKEHCVKSNGIIYHGFTQKSKKQLTEIGRIYDKHQPDIVHIFGTEYLHSHYATKAAVDREMPTVVSIQGLASTISQHINASLPIKIIKRKSLRNLVFNDNIEGLSKIFKKRGVYEIKTLKMTKNIIGRTTWDFAITNQINPHSTYYHCNEILRESFYQNKWNYDEIDEYTIFLSQGGYSLKGLHHMINALPIIKKKFPKVKVYVGGHDITDNSTIKERLKKNYYDKYILQQIKSKNLENNIEFTGILNEKEMVNQYLKSHVFVCPSSIENSPNSVGEAMILGVPVVASYVGGIPDMITHCKEGYLYQSDSHQMLAYFICEIFSNKNDAIEMGRNARTRALSTHSTSINTDETLRIYKDILKVRD